MDEHVYHDFEDEIRREALSVEGIKGIEKRFIRKAGMNYHVDLHATVQADLTMWEGHDIARRLKKRSIAKFHTSVMC